MRFVATCFLLTVSAVMAFAAPPSLKVPEEDVRAIPGRLLKLKVETTGKYLSWDLVDAPENADLDVAADGKSASFVGPNEGRYRIVVVASSETGELTKSVFYVVVGESMPAKPDAALVKAFTEAGVKDGATAADFRKLAKVYEVGSDKTKDDALKTWGDLFNEMAKEAKSVDIAGKLQNVQAVVQAELQKRLVDSNGKPVTMEGQLAAAYRSKAKVELKRISNALTACVK